MRALFQIAQQRLLQSVLYVMGIAQKHIGRAVEHVAVGLQDTFDFRFVLFAQDGFPLSMFYFIEKLRQCKPRRRISESSHPNRHVTALL